MIVYLVHNKINHKNYVGQTAQILCKRRGNHYAKTTKEDSLFGRALRKYKRKDLDWHILIECPTVEEANLWERFYIKLLQSNNRQFGYNLLDGGLNQKHNEESKRKISIANKGKHSETWRGKKHSEETILKMKESAKKRWRDNPMTDEMREKMSLSKKGKKNINWKLSEEGRLKLRNQMLGHKYWVGKHHSEETKKKMRLIYQERQNLNGINSEK